MKSSWRTRSLDDVCTFTSGLWKGETPPFVNVGVIRNTNFTKEGSLDDSDIAYLDVEVRKLEKRRLRLGDIILEKSGGGPKQPVGRVALFDKSQGDFSFSNFTSALRVKTPDEVDFRFLHKYLFWIHLSGVTEQMQSHSTGIRNLDSDAYKAIPIYFPPLTEQRRIVAILDEAFEGIATAKANAEENIENARAVFESRRESLLGSGGPGWARSPLAELCDIKHGFAFKSEFFSKKGDYVLLTPGNFFEEGGYRDRGDKQKHYVGVIPESFVLSKGDLLVAMTEQAAGLLGSPIIVPESGKFLHNQRLGLVTKKPGVVWTNEFFYHVFNTRSVRRAIHDSASGTKVRHTSPTKIGTVVVSHPRTVNRQIEIAENLNSLASEVARLTNIYRIKAASLDELRNSLLRQVFSPQM